VLPGCEIQRLLPREKGQKLPKALIWGWPSPVPLNARTEMPPLPRRPVYGPAAREEARRLMREAAKAKINFGPFTKINLCRVARGEGPLSHDVWKRAVLYLERIEAEREAVRRRAMPSKLSLTLTPGSRPGLGWARPV
jgi:hypothetical protein